MDLMCPPNGITVCISRPTPRKSLAEALEKTLDCPMVSQASPTSLPSEGHPGGIFHSSRCLDNSATLAENDACRSEPSNRRRYRCDLTRLAKERAAEPETIVSGASCASSMSLRPGRA